MLRLARDMPAGRVFLPAQRRVRERLIRVTSTAWVADGGALRARAVENPEHCTGKASLPRQVHRDDSDAVGVAVGRSRSDRGHGVVRTAQSLVGVRGCLGQCGAGTEQLVLRGQQHLGAGIDEGRQRRWRCPRARVRLCCLRVEGRNLFVVSVLGGVGGLLASPVPVEGLGCLIDRPGQAGMVVVEGVGDADECLCGLNPLLDSVTAMVAERLANCAGPVGPVGQMRHRRTEIHPPFADPAEPTRGGGDGVGTTPDQLVRAARSAQGDVVIVVAAHHDGLDPIEHPRSRWMREAKTTAGKVMRAVDLGAATTRPAALRRVLCGGTTDTRGRAASRPMRFRLTCDHRVVTALTR